MSELLILLALAWFLRSWLQAPTNKDYEDLIVMIESEGGED